MNILSTARDAYGGIYGTKMCTGFNIANVFNIAKFIIIRKLVINAHYMVKQATQL